MDTLKSSVGAPSGSEVEPVRHHVPLPAEPMERDSIKQKIDRWKSAGVSKTRTSVAKVQSNLRGNAAKWAGIAAGAGLVLGITGRYLRRRARLRALPDLVIVEAVC